MTDLEKHLMARERMKCPTIARAWAGGEAAHRTAGIRSRYLRANEEYGKAWRRWEEAGENLRAVDAAAYGEICALMIDLWKAKRGVVVAENITINLERAA